ncbi:MAG: Cys-tRNA(Pro) deacylase [Clostridia bacterium]|nr:Cys-tRNA(Pro) deacylase [Clostridia bacterium]
MSKPVKTNVLRHLDAAKIPYETISYAVDEENFDGKLVSQKTGLDPQMVFKTLVLCDDRNGHLTCMIPVEQELDLKKVARASGHKSVSMLPMKELLPLTGYVRGGCSPIGMKKHFPTFLDQAALSQETISVSAGVRGCQVILRREDLIACSEATVADLTRETP